MMSKKFTLLLSAFALLVSFQNSESLFAQSTIHGGGNGLQCSNQPVPIDLSQEFKLEENNGQNRVSLQWQLAKDSDTYQDEKQTAFINYLKNDPKLGISQKKLKNVFSSYVYQELIHSENPSVQKNFRDALASTLETSQVLKDINVVKLFTDYYPYLFVQQLKTEPQLAKVFLMGLGKGLKGETINPSELLKNLFSTLKQIPEEGPIQKTASCMSRVVGNSTLDQFKPDNVNNVYTSKRGVVQAAINALKEQGKIQPLLESLENDRQLVAETKEGLKVGINTVLGVWAKNQNVQNLIKFYQTDPKARALVDRFFESAVGSKLDRCVQDNYGASLLDLTKESYLGLLTSKLDFEKNYNDQEADVIFAAFEKLLSDGTYQEVQDETEQVTQKFINDYLTLEEKTKQAAPAAKTPFTDYYQEELEKYVGPMQGMWIEIQRDGQVIQRISNTNITQFTDDQIPKNDSGNMAYHQYTLVTRTQCESKTGASVQVAINPTFKDGTTVEALADVEIRLKNSQSKFFMERLEVLLKALWEGKKTLNSPQNGLESDQKKACDLARADLLAKKTSDKLFPYVLSCFGDGQINESLQGQLKDIVNPLIRFLELNHFADPDKVTEVFLTPLIQVAREEYKIKTEVFKEAQSLTKEAQYILKAETIDDLTEDQRQLIKCAGQRGCSERVKSLMEKYFLNASHAAEIVIEVYDSKGKMLLTKTAHTDMFGQVKQIPLGELKTGINYIFKVKLKDQPYALPKVSQVRLTEAVPVTSGKPQATVKLQTTSPYFYGNFDNSNDLIDLKDIQAWSKLMEKDPQKWSTYNVDGFTGIDLFDASLMQMNWGEKAQEAVQSSRLTLAELMKTLGYSGGNSTPVYAPEWFLKIQ